MDGVNPWQCGYILLMYLLLFICGSYFQAASIPSPLRIQPEIAVLDYQSTQTRIIPMLATTYALHFTKVGG